MCHVTQPHTPVNGIISHIYKEKGLPISRVHELVYQQIVIFYQAIKPSRNGCGGLESRGIKFGILVLYLESVLGSVFLGSFSFTPLLDLIDYCNLRA